MNTPILNSVIVPCCLIGIFFVMRQGSRCGRSALVAPLPASRGKARRRSKTHSINLLAPLAAMVGDRQTISPVAHGHTAVLDGIATRLDERRELTRYLIGPADLPRLLGTSVGLLETIGRRSPTHLGRCRWQRRRCHPDVRQSSRKASKPAKGMRRRSGASLFGLSGIAGAGFSSCRQARPRPLPYRAEEWLGPAPRALERRPGRATRACRLCRGPARAHRRRPRRTDAHAAPRRGRPRSNGRGQRHLVEGLARLAEAMRPADLACRRPSSRSSCAAPHQYGERTEPTAKC